MGRLVPTPTIPRVKTASISELAARLNELLDQGVAPHAAIRVTVPGVGTMNVDTALVMHVGRDQVAIVAPN